MRALVFVGEGSDEKGSGSWKAREKRVTRKGRRVDGAKEGRKRLCFFSFRCRRPTPLVASFSTPSSLSPSLLRAATPTLPPDLLRVVVHLALLEANQARRELGRPLGRSIDSQLFAAGLFFPLNSSFFLDLTLAASAPHPAELRVSPPNCCREDVSRAHAAKGAATRAGYALPGEIEKPVRPTGATREEGKIKGEK